ncbi:glycosyltransferase family 39 protein [Actinoplanes rectilineatus]|uniref:glycosyltransferase family 39 protein n=1 Tax=Actinoplanes rectilineatus TaxID=113571 RepID=UPI0005F2D02A|nr:phospholipid carrier-dependent glycosyltransferase [Actinoplanes rectilineatus]
MTTETLNRADETTRRRPGPRATTALTVVGLAALTLVLRLIGVRTAYDVFVDEPFYVSLGRSVADGHLVPIGSGTPFLLHPPGFFWLEAAWSAIMPFTGDAFYDIHNVRILQALLAAGSVALLFFLVRRLAGARTAIIASVIFSLDPYLLQQNGRVMLETTTLAFLLGGFLLITRIAQHATAARTREAILAGALFGCAILTKDIALLVVVLPLATIAVSGWFRMRRAAIVAAGTAVGMYLVYVLVLLVSGYGSAFWTAKTGGLSRAVGTDVTTGFSAAGSPTLTGALWSQSYLFFGSYAIVALGSVAGLWLLIRPRVETDRIVGLFTAASGVVLGYALVFGTIEEQFLYFLSVPAIAALTVCAARLVGSGRRQTQETRFVLGALTALLLVLNVFSWSYIHAHTDDGQKQAHRWLMANAPEGSGVAWVASQTEISLRGTTFRTVELGTPEEMAAQHITYVVLLEKAVAEGYTDVSPATLKWYAQHSTKVFSYVGRSQGEVSVYRTNDASAW